MNSKESEIECLVKERKRLVNANFEIFNFKFLIMKFFFIMDVERNLVYSNSFHPYICDNHFPAWLMRNFLSRESIISKYTMVFITIEGNFHLSFVKPE